MLVFDQVSYAYRQGNPVLRKLSIEIKRGDFVSVIGGNGSGKSTLAKLMNGLLQPGEGQVTLNGWNTQKPDEVRRIRELAGLVFQNPDDQFITTSVWDEVIFGLENLRVPRADMAERVNQALQAVHMKELAEAMPHQLSGGQKQRVAIAAVLAMSPSVLILDEATSMLDPQGRSDILEVLHNLHRQGMTVIHITHHMDEVLSSGRVLLLSNGEVAFDGTPSTLFNGAAMNEHRPALPFAARVHQALGLNAPVRADWKETISSLWSTP